MALERVPPYNLEAELTVIASILLDEEGEALHEIIDKLSPDDFYKEAHKHVISAIMRLFADGEPVNLVSLAEALKREEKLAAVGGQAYLASFLQASVSSMVNLEYYLGIVKSKAEIRKLIKGANEILEVAYSDTEYSDDIIDRAENIILQVAEHRFRTTQLPIKEIVDPTMESIGKMWNSKGGLSGMATGYMDFDQMTNGLHGGELIIIAARPSMGKTAFCLNLAANVSIRNKKKVAIFSLEMSSMSIVQRMICSEAKISAHKVMKGKFSQQEWVNMTTAASAIKYAPIWIDDDAGLSYMDIRSKCRRLASKNQGLDLVIVDYLQLISSPPGLKNQNRTLEIGDISRNLKILAKELKVPVVCLSQLNRKIEERANQEPMLSDLRDSGAIEQDADLVAFLHREKNYRAKGKNSDEDDAFRDEDSAQGEKAEIIIAKQRNGPIGAVPLVFLGDYMRFENYTKG